MCCGYSFELPQRSDSNEYPQHMFLWRNNKTYPSIILKYPLKCSLDSLSSETILYFNDPNYGDRQVLPNSVSDWLVSTLFAILSLCLDTLLT